jgi:hypothetical protein
VVSKTQVTKPITVYFVTVITGHLVWETVQLPLYTLWWTGTKSEIVRALLHCTAGDALITAATLTLALLAARFAEWPTFGIKMMATTILLGVAYTMFSEWLNVEIRRSWAYTRSMPGTSGPGDRPRANATVADRTHRRIRSGAPITSRCTT